MRTQRLFVYFWNIFYRPWIREKTFLRERQKNRFFCLQKKFNYKFGKENAFFHRQHKKNSLMHRKLFFHGRSKEFFFLLLPEQKVCLPKREFFWGRQVFSAFFLLPFVEDCACLSFLFFGIISFSSLQNKTQAKRMHHFRTWKDKWTFPFFVLFWPPMFRLVKRFGTCVVSNSKDNNNKKTQEEKRKTRLNIKICFVFEIT